MRILISVSQLNYVWKPVDSTLFFGMQHNSLRNLFFYSSRKTIRIWKIPALWEFYSSISGKTTCAPKICQKYPNFRGGLFLFCKNTHTYTHTPNCLTFSIRKDNLLWEIGYKTPNALRLNSCEINFNLTSQTMACS